MECSKALRNVVIDLETRNIGYPSAVETCTKDLGYLIRHLRDEGKAYPLCEFHATLPFHIESRGVEVDDRFVLVDIDIRELLGSFLAACRSIEAARAKEADIRISSVLYLIGQVLRAGERQW